MTQCAELREKSWKQCELGIAECRCNFNDIEHVIEVLQYHQDWRRGAAIEMIHPTVIGLAIDSAIYHLKGKDAV